MRGVAKMAMLNAAKTGDEMRGTYGEMRYGGIRSEMENHFPPPVWREPEDRRRDSRGRFVRGYSAEVMGNYPNTTETMRYDSRGGERSYGEREERYPAEKAPMQIGFRYEEDTSRYRSDVPYPRMNETEHLRSQMHKGHAQGLGTGKLDKQTAEDWVNSMITEDGYKGKHWGLEQTNQVMKQFGIDCDPLEFFVAMNMMFSDYGKVAKEMGLDNTEFYAKMSKAFLKDPDAGPEKLMAYYTAIAAK